MNWADILPETDIFAPEYQWLEEDRLLLGPIFRCQVLVSGSVKFVRQFLLDLIAPETFLMGLFQWVFTLECFLGPIKTPVKHVDGGVSGYHLTHSI